MKIRKEMPLGRNGCDISIAGQRSLMKLQFVVVGLLLWSLTFLGGSDMDYNGTKKTFADAGIQVYVPDGWHIHGKQPKGVIEGHPQRLILQVGAADEKGSVIVSIKGIRPDHPDFDCQDIECLLESLLNQLTAAFSASNQTFDAEKRLFRGKIDGQKSIAISFSIKTAERASNNFGYLYVIDREGQFEKPSMR